MIIATCIVEWRALNGLKEFSAVRRQREYAPRKTSKVRTRWISTAYMIEEYYMYPTLHIFALRNALASCKIESAGHRAIQWPS